jgi:hypothetical protein
MVIKRYIKSGLRLLRNHLQSKKISYSQDALLFMHFDMELEPIIKNIQDKKICCILVIFHNEKTNTMVTERIQKLKELNPDLKFYVITAFSNIKYLTDLGQKFNEVKIVNSLCIANFEQLISVLRQNCHQDNIDLFNEKFYHEKFTRLGYKYIQKIFINSAK